MIKNLISIIVAVVILAAGVYVHLELSTLNVIIALVALIIAITFRAHVYKTMFSIVGLIHFIYLIRYIYDWILSFF